MLYDFEFYTNRPSYYSRPRYYSPYSPYYSYSSYLKDRYYYPYRYYTPWYRSSLPYSSVSPYYPYRPNYSYTPLSKILPETYPEAEKYWHTYGIDFDSTAKDIRAETFRLLQDARQTVARTGSVPRFERDSSVPRSVRASSLERPSFDKFIDSDDDYYRAKRAVSRQRMMSEGPSSSYRNYVY